MSDRRISIIFLFVSFLCSYGIVLIMSTLGCYLNSWQFWGIIIIVIVMHMCGVIEEHLKK